MEYVASLLMAIIWGLTGLLLKHYPETLAGYNTLSAERKKQFDIQGAGRLLARVLFTCSAISALGVICIVFGWEVAANVTLLIPIPILLIGLIWGSIRFSLKSKKE